MRFITVRRLLLLASLPLAAASCVSSTPDPGSPVPAQLTDRQADVLARGYFDAKPITGPRTLVAEERHERGWWLRYQGPFDPTTKPPQASYLVEVNNAGTVRDVD